MARPFIHPSTDCQAIEIGADTCVWQFCVILKGASIGSGCNISAHCFVENDVVIGNDVTVKCGVYLWDGLRVEDRVFIGPNATFTNDKYPRSKSQPGGKWPTTVLRRGCTIGAGAILLPGVEIGEGAMVAAGALVTKDVPAHMLAIGVPASIAELPTAGADPICRARAG